MDLELTGRRAIVAGSSAGLGLGVATALAEAGCAVVVSGRDSARVEAAARSIPGAHPVCSDLSSATGAVAFIEEAKRALGGADILILNSGGPPPGTFSSTAIEAYGQALDGNLLAMIAMCQVVVPDMQRQRWGRVVAITGIGVRQPLPTLIASTTARAGLTAFLKTLANEIAHDGVTVNTLQPGLHATARLRAIYGDNIEAAVAGIPSGELGDPSAFGRIAAFLCSEHSRYITGASIPVDGGLYAGLQ